jgi:tRNA threonylcarbamoyladenosine biosynthesis protein TsaB
MSVILNIDTSGEIASVSLSRDRKVLAAESNRDQKDHAAWLHVAIATLVNDSGLTMQGIDAVAVAIGPGSYTGLRVGLSAAKGLCYALDIPLIEIGTLHLLAAASHRQHEADSYCALIDARRMEVYCAVYDADLNETQAPSAMIIDSNSFGDLISSQRVVFCGDGSKKLQNLISHANVVFDFAPEIIPVMPDLSHDLYDKNIYADLAYTEPLYIKEFHSPLRKPFI